MAEHRVSFKVHGEPVPMPRPRTVTKGGKTWTFSGSKKSRDYAKSIKKACNGTKHHFDSAMLKVILSTEKQVDVDNVAKSVMDALTGVLWDNDKAVWYLAVTRMDGFSDPQGPYTEVEVIGEEPEHVQSKLLSEKLEELKTA